MKKPDVKQQLAIIQTHVAKYRVYILTALVLALFVQLSFDLRRMGNPPVSAELYEQKRQELEKNRIKLDEATITQIEQRTIRGDDVNPDRTGNSNPFD